VALILGAGGGAGRSFERKSAKPILCMIASGRIDIVAGPRLVAGS
jgi:hypothetical protein